MSLLSYPVSNVGDGRKTVAAAGTPEQLSTTTTGISWVVVTAETDNTGLISVGTSTTDATLTAQRGMLLAAGDSVVLPIRQLTALYIDSTVSGDGVSFFYGIP